MQEIRISSASCGICTVIGRRLSESAIALCHTGRFCKSWTCRRRSEAADLLAYAAVAKQYKLITDASLELFINMCYSKESIRLIRICEGRGREERRGNLRPIAISLGQSDSLRWIAPGTSAIRTYLSERLGCLWHLWRWWLPIVFLALSRARRSPLCQKQKNIFLASASFSRAV